MSAERVATVTVTRVTESGAEPVHDLVVVEEPLEMSVAWGTNGDRREKAVSVTMRTPGDDCDLAAGFLFSEGLVGRGEEIESIRHWGSPNHVRVTLAAGARLDTSRIDRHFYTTSSCGVCGKTSIDALRTGLCALTPAPPVEPALVAQLPAALARAQSTFRATGGSHGAAIVSSSGEVLRAREDIGRHNAVDKVIGSYVREGALPPAGSLLMVSSRGSFEIVQKALVAGIGLLAFAGPPSTLAVDLARAFNVTLLGFVREGRFNVYSGEIG